MNLCGLEIEVLEIRSQYFSAFVPFGNDVQVLALFGIVVFVGLDIFSLFLSVPPKKRQFDSVCEFILIVSFLGLFLIFFLLLHHSLHILVVDNSFLDGHFRELLVSLDINVNILIFEALWLHFVETTLALFFLSIFSVGIGAVSVLHIFVVLLREFIVVVLVEQLLCLLT